VDQAYLQNLSQNLRGGTGCGLDGPEGLVPSILLDELLEGMRVNPAPLFGLGYGLQLVGVSLGVSLNL
jgi:hypothetical protein